MISIEKSVRNIPEPVLQALHAQAPRKPVTREIKTNQRRPDSNQVAVHALALRALGLPLSFQVEEIEYLALQIAQRQRDQHELQSYQSIRSKLESELALIEQVQPDAVFYRVASVVYYYAQQFLHDHDLPAFQMALYRLSERYNVPVELLVLICLAKFRDRAARATKDVSSELAAIDATITNFYAHQKLVPKTLD